MTTLRNKQALAARFTASDQGCEEISPERISAEYLVSTSAASLAPAQPSNGDMHALVPFASVRFWDVPKGFHSQLRRYIWSSRAWHKLHAGVGSKPTSFGGLDTGGLRSAK